MVVGGEAGVKVLAVWVGEEAQSQLRLDGLGGRQQFRRVGRRDDFKVEGVIALGEDPGVVGDDRLQPDAQVSGRGLGEAVKAAALGCAAKGIELFDSRAVEGRYENSVMGFVKE